MSSDLFAAMGELWQDSPRWRNLALASAVCTVMIFVFPPNFSSSPQSSYTPPPSTAGKPTPPPIDRGLGTPPVPPMPSGVAPGTVYSTGVPLKPVAPAPLKIKPSEKGTSEIIIEKETSNDGFGRAPQERGNSIKPSGQ